jgi:hypothetical protein
LKRHTLHQHRPVGYTVDKIESHMVFIPINGGIQALPFFLVILLE